MLTARIAVLASGGGTNLQALIDSQDRGELRGDLSEGEITKLYALTERALMYDWCICNGDYSLKQYAKRIMPLLLSEIRAPKT